MKLRPLLLFVSVIHFRCQPSTDHINKQEESLSQSSLDTMLINPSKPNEQNPAPKENSEYLEWQTIRINGRLPLITTVKNMEGLLGKPDSVVHIDFDEICPSDFRSENPKIAYLRLLTTEGLPLSNLEIPLAL
jgi:hypothetical protein